MGMVLHKRWWIARPIMDKPPCNRRATIYGRRQKLRP